MEPTEERQVLSDIAINKQQLLPSAMDFTKFNQRNRQQSLILDFINSPTTNKKRSLPSIDETLNQSKKLKIYCDNDNNKENKINFEDEEKDTKRKYGSYEENKLNLTKNDRNSIDLCLEYNDQIFEYLIEREANLKLDFNYVLDKQSIFYLRPHLRAILIDWLVEVHEKFQCVTETLLLSINIMDRFLSKNKIKVAKLQLVAITCLFIAAKFYEINLPKLASYAYVTDGAATVDEIKLAEFQILKAINFEIAWPNPLNFLRKLTINQDAHVRELSKCILEIAYCSPNFIDLKPSQLSTLSVYLSLKINALKIKNNDVSATINMYYDTTKENIEFKKQYESLIDEIASPSTKLDCLIQKFKRKNIYSEIVQWCKKQE